LLFRVTGWTINLSNATLEGVRFINPFASDCALEIWG
jgi:hypothetical protein